MTTKRYKYRAYPSGEQAQNLSRLFGSCRVVFNDYIAERERLRRTGLSKQVKADQTASLVTTQAKTTAERVWLAEVSSVPLQQSVRDAQRAYSNFFDSLTKKRKGPRMGAPRFKKRRNRQSARFTHAAGFKVLDTGGSKWGKVRLPKIGDLMFDRSRALPSVPSSVTVIREPDGSVWVSFVVEVETVAVDASNPGRVAAIDLGLIDLAAVAYSDGTREKVANPRHLRAAARRLARQQREHARKVKGSANREKARIKVARTHRRVADLRSDHHHKLANRLIAENETIVLETLSLRGMGRTRLAKSVYDAGLGNLIRLITEKAESQGRSVLRIGQWEPTTQTCSVCGAPGGKKPLSVREWTCDPVTRCGAWLDRDYNAALNIMLAAGLAERLNACGPDVRRLLAGATGATPGDRTEAGTHRTNRTKAPVGASVAAA